MLLKVMVFHDGQSGANSEQLQKYLNVLVDGLVKCQTKFKAKKSEIIDTGEDKA